MEQMRAQAEHVGARLENEHVVALDLAARPFRIDCDSGRALERRRDHPGDRRQGQMARICRARRRSRALASRPARPATASSSAARRWSSSAAAIRRSRRRCISRSIAAAGDRRASPRLVPRREDPASTGCSGAPNVEVKWNRTVEEILGGGDAARASPARVLRDVCDRRARGDRRRRRVRRHRPRAGDRTRARPGRAEAERLCRRPRRARPRPASRACSPPATSPTTSFVRRSPPRGSAAWRRSRPSAGCARQAPSVPLKRDAIGRDGDDRVTPEGQRSA